MRMPQQRIPSAWRKTLTSEEAICAAVADRLGIPSGAAHAAQSAAMAAATTERHRLPGIWMDPMGSACAALQKGQADQDPAGPVSPGTSPGKHHFLAKYNEYVGLEEWEARQHGLNDAVPRRRMALRDYGHHTRAGAPTEVTSKPLAIADATAASWAPTPSPLPLANTPLCSEGSASAGRAAALPWRPSPTTREAGRLCVGLSPRPRPVQAGAVPLEAPRPRGSSDAEALVEAREAPSGPSPPPLPSARAALVADLAAGATLGEESAEAGEARRDEPQPLRVHMVPPNALVFSAEGPVGHRGGKGGQQAPKVQDRDSARHMSSQERRPARIKNLDFKRKLRNVLELQNVLKLDATGQHPSRSYGVIPSQNLRVA